MHLHFTVLGAAQPQGSKRIGRTWKGHPLILDANDAKLLPWRQQVGQTAKALAAQAGWEMIKRPNAAVLDLVFYFDRPESVKKSLLKTTKPDLDKLQRAVMDALTGILFQDDAQVNDVHAVKRFAEEGSGARVEIFITTEQRAVQVAGGGQALTLNAL